MSSTTGVPPSSATAVATAAPSPDAPPVTMTMPRDSGDTGHLDQSRGRMFRYVRHDHRAGAPFGQHGGLGQFVDVVVAALDPDVGAQLAQDRARVVLLEDRDDVDAGERGE